MKSSCTLDIYFIGHIELFGVAPMLTFFAQFYQKKKIHGFTLIWLKARQGDQT